MEYSNQILQGDVIDRLRDLPSESVHCGITSPPYWNLRDYQVAGQLGREATPEEYLEKMCEVFWEIRRVLRPDGSVWLNMGDSYAGYWGEHYAHKPFGEDRTPDASTVPNKPSLLFTRNVRSSSLGGSHRTNYQQLRAHENGSTLGLKPKDMIGIPWRLALALRDSGWYLRSEIIWYKTNAMPESVTDRPTKSHEHIFLLTKSERYFYDQTAIMEDCSPNTHLRVSQDTLNQAGSNRANGGTRSDRSMKTVVRAVRKSDAGIVGQNKSNASMAESIEFPVFQRNKRTVWTLPVQGFQEAHFAVFPERLVDPMIKAGTSLRGCCQECGAPYRRVVRPSERYAKILGVGYHDHQHDEQRGRAGRRASNRQNAMRDAGMAGPEYETVGWEDGCQCGAPIIPCTVLDPFSGAGTTLIMAHALGRRFIGIDLNPEYIEITRRRFRTEFGMFSPL